MEQEFYEQNLALKDIWRLRSRVKIMMDVKQISLHLELFYLLCMLAIHHSKEGFLLIPTIS
jgi:hypothetical protein